MCPVRRRTATGIATTASARSAATVRPTSDATRSLLVRVRPSFFPAWERSGMGKTKGWSASRLKFQAGDTRTDRRHLLAYLAATPPVGVPKLPTGDGTAHRFSSCVSHHSPLAVLPKPGHNILSVGAELIDCTR